jgi:hypothetical protein
MFDDTFKENVQPAGILVRSLLRVLWQELFLGVINVVPRRPRLQSRALMVGLRTTCPFKAMRIPCTSPALVAPFIK